MIDPSILDRYLEEDTHRAMNELARLVAIPSVAARGQGMEPCARLVASLLHARGLDARVEPTGGSPIVYGEDLRAGPDAPTVLFYNHYDVQPAEPLDAWQSPPFELSVRRGIAYGRGVSDDKGHIVCRLMALDALAHACGGRLPVNVKFLIEGEEEVASVHLPGWMEKNADRLRADVCIWEFGGVDESGHPEIVCGLRGIVYFELRAKTLRYDAHSGVGGSLFPNAAWRLVWALSTLKSPDERILLPGHYDAVRPPTGFDLELLEALPSEEAWLKREWGIDNFLSGAAGPEYRRRQIFEPTCTVCGLSSGYEGEGTKTVIPAEATAKVDFRLVPDQDPEAVHRALRRHLDENGFSDIEVVRLGGMAPARVDPTHPMVTLCARTARDVYRVPPALIPMSGVGGPIHAFVVGLGLPVVTCGVGYPGNRVHAPDENLRLSDLLLGARHTAHFLAALSAGPDGPSPQRR